MMWSFFEFSEIQIFYWNIHLHIFKVYLDFEQLP